MDVFQLLGLSLLLSQVHYQGIGSDVRSRDLNWDSGVANGSLAHYSTMLAIIIIIIIICILIFVFSPHEKLLVVNKILSLVLSFSYSTCSG